MSEYATSEENWSTASSSSSEDYSSYYYYEDFPTMESFATAQEDSKKKETSTKWQRKRAYELTLPLHVRQKRRLAANARERKRMTSLNQAFEKLREILPNQHRDRPLSKMEALQLAQNYIKEMSSVLNFQQYNEVENTAQNYNQEYAYQNYEEQVAYY